MERWKFKQFARGLAVFVTAGATLCAGQAAAQQRATINDGFEENDPQGPGTATFEILDDTEVPGWVSTTGKIELWDSNFLSVPAHEGAVFAEMNANSPGSLYQDICLVNGETIGWSFAHRARTGGPSTQNASLEIADSSGAEIQQLTTQASTTSNLVWTVNSGSATYTQASGIQRVRFTTTDPGSYGNFLDAISISLKPFVQLSVSTASGVEGSASADLPKLLISGNVTTAFTVRLRATGGTATRGVEYTTPTGNRNFTVTIPAGTYDNTPIDTGIQIIDDSDLEGTDTFNLRLRTGDDYTRASTTSCGGSSVNDATYSIIDDDARLTLSKQWVNANVGDSATLSLSRGGTQIDALSSTASAPGQTDDDPTPTEVVIGETLILAEALGGANQREYQATPSCTGAADTDLSDGLTIGSGETAITCTYTNIGISPLLVSKTSSVVSDGISVTNAKALPDAVVRYCILVSNPGVLDAEAITAIDDLITELTYITGTLRSGTTCANAATIEDEDDTGADETDPLGVKVTGDVIEVTLATLAPSESFALQFDAVLD